MSDTEDRALYIKHNGRGWCVWVNSGTLRAIPEDEEEYNEEDIINLTNYLAEEGFFPEFFENKEGADEVGF